MKRFILIAYALMFSASLVQAQNSNPGFVVFTCGEDTVFSSEFWKIFNKNNSTNKKAERQELEEYLDLYVKFKLKVNEAFSRGMDTNKAFVNELNGYRKQLAQPYLTDNEVTDKLIKEAYERMQHIVRASHIMVALDPNASAADTLVAWNKIMSHYEALRKGANFDSLAFKASEDPSAQGIPGNRGYQGDLGYFTAFQMVYPFETAAFSMNIGDFSWPIRTSFGYHLIKLYDKKPNPGDIKVAHIMIRFNNEDEVPLAKEKIDAVYAKFKEGISFEDLVDQYTEDFSSRTRGGQLNWFSYTTDNIPKAFREAAFALKSDNDVSIPVKSDFGWHIIKRIELKPLDEIEAMRETLKARIARDSRSRLNKEAVLLRIKKENGFREVPGAYDRFTVFVDASIVEGNWHQPAIFTQNEKIFELAGKQYLFSDFADFIERTQSKRNGTNITVLKEMYNEYVERVNFDFEESVLEVKYPDFKFLMEEYRDGILLFELTDKEVWSKSVQDTAGLEAFYIANQKNYMWKDRADAEIYLCKDGKTATRVAKAIKKKKDRNTIISEGNKKDPLAIRSEVGLFEMGKNEYLNEFEWKTGVQLKELKDKVLVVNIRELRSSEPKMMNEAMGLITSDYQNALEKNWLEGLKMKFPVLINPNAIDELLKL